MEYFIYFFLNYYCAQKSLPGKLFYVELLLDFVIYTRFNKFTHRKLYITCNLYRKHIC